MALLRFKIELNPGGEGVRLDKLAKLSGEIEKFLRFLANDSGANVKPGEWLAKNFYDSSFGALLEYGGNVDPAVVGRFNSNVRYFSRFTPQSAPNVGRYSDQTLKQFVQVGEALDIGERFRLGLIADESQGVEWEDISKGVTLLVDEIISDEIEWYGSVQGGLGTWFKESNYFYLRDLVVGGAIKCYYVPRMYAEVYALFKNKDAVVHAHGTVRGQRNSGRPKEIRVTEFSEYTPLTDNEFEQLLSGMPERTDVQSTLDMIERRRENGDQ